MECLYRALCKVCVPKVVVFTLTLWIDQTSLMEVSLLVDVLCVKRWFQNVLTPMMTKCPTTELVVKERSEHSVYCQKEQTVINYLL